LPTINGFSKETHASLSIAIVHTIKGRISIKILKHSKKIIRSQKDYTQEINLTRVYQALIPIEK
jgi:hypothetical protein